MRERVADLAGGVEGATELACSSSSIAVGADAVQTGQRLVGVEQSPDRVRACFADGTAASGDALVAANGIHSMLRAQLIPDEGPPRWNGMQMWRGATEWRQFRGGQSMIVAGGTGAKLADVISAAEIDEVLSGYATATGASPPSSRC